MARARRRSGAYRWRIFENPNREGRFVETWLTDSWLELLRQHVRVTKADRPLLRAVNRFHLGDAPEVTYLIAADTAKSVQSHGRPS